MTSKPISSRRSDRMWLVLALAAWCLTLVPGVKAALQFDVFVGFDTHVREAGWFPITCEVFNDGPSFKAIFEVSPSGFGSEQKRRLALELPTNTRKRFVIPVFATKGRLSAQWDARLLDEQGHERAKRESLPTTTIAWNSVLLGALPRQFGGMPVLPDPKNNRNDNKPAVARLQPEHFPDNPVALEGLDALYLNSEKAQLLRVEQVTALVNWVRQGGHLIVAVEQPVDVNSLPWLQQFLPFEVTGVSAREIDQDIINWVKNENTDDLQRATARRARSVADENRTGRNAYAELPLDATFVAASMPVAQGRVKDGRIRITAEGAPLVVEAPRGRGRVTVLNFSPEREPFRSWKQRGYFWARLLNVPSDFLIGDSNSFGSLSIDGVFGALIDSRQVKKLPVEWLLLLLLVYLFVIGPFDQYWLKKINRQMLTWITFPTYVALFSVLIYFIGYKLRAGETEWNEVSIVDILPRGTQADLRGRTYISIYSSANSRYTIASDLPVATFRTEFLDIYGSGNDSAKAEVNHKGKGFSAEVFVPVWTSMLYVNDWMETAPLPFTATLQPGETEGSGTVTIANHLDRPLRDIRAVYNGFVYELGALEAGQKKDIALDRGKSTLLSNFLLQHGGRFRQAVDARRNPLGHDHGRLDQGPLVATAASFAEQLHVDREQRFVSPAGLDLSEIALRGDAIIVAWDPNRSPLKPLHQFKPPREAKNTLYRLTVPVKTTATP